MFFVSLENDRGYFCGTSVVFGFEKAGEGLCIKRVDSYLPSYDFFVSPEDYERYKAGGDGAYQIPILFTTDILRECDYKWSCGGILVWHEANGEPKQVMIRDYRLWIDRDGAHIEPLTTKSYFKTREECARTIPKAKVVDFEEEVVETKPPVKRLDRDSALICESIQQVTLVAWPMIYGKDNPHDLSSIEVLETFRRWGEEFESWWIDHDEAWISEHDYTEEVELFAEKKATEYINSIK
jgi:hypothetical protein